MRSLRRGMKEMDLILGRFADGRLASLEPAMLDRYESMLSENDQDLYRWITARVGQRTDPGGPAALAPILDEVAAEVGRNSAF